MVWRSIAVGLTLWWFLGCQENTPDRTGDPGRESDRGGTMKLDVRSTAFAQGATIPKKYTKDGEDISPPLTWTAPPAGTKSLAIVCDDPDAPVGTWDHWVLWGLPAETTELSEGLGHGAALPAGTRRGRNSWKRPGYEGPSPPPGKPHRYFFRVYALDTVLALEAGATKARLQATMKGHVLAMGELMGRYGR